MVSGCPMSLYKNKIVITGGSGRFGSKLKKIKNKFKLIFPNKRELNILNLKSIKKYLEIKKPKYLIHLAGLSRPMENHNKHIGKSIDLNIIGTANITKVCSKLGIKLIYFSTTYVYPGIKGNYKETDATSPYNIYGWSKLGAECSVRCLSNFCIIRTRFFDPSHIPFKKSASDLYTSSIPIEDLVDAIIKILSIDLVGIINIGFPRQSDYQLYKPCLMLSFSF